MKINKICFWVSLITEGLWSRMTSANIWKECVGFFLKLDTGDSEGTGHQLNRTAHTQDECDRVSKSGRSKRATERAEQTVTYWGVDSCVVRVINEPLVENKTLVLLWTETKQSRRHTANCPSKRSRPVTTCDTWLSASLTAVWGNYHWKTL